MPRISSDNIPESLSFFLKETAEALDRAFAARFAYSQGLAPSDGARKLAEACLYAWSSGGKRIRPALVRAGAEALHGTMEAALPAAIAVECLHTYTLIHDDLPAMDDDQLRRGKPTVHIAFDQGTAILAGDALCTEAFLALSDLNAAGPAVKILAEASGVKHLLAGQARDLSLFKSNASHDLSLETIELVHHGKTAALFAASLQLGVLCGGGNAEQQKNAHALGLAIGLAFQFADDLDDNDFPEKTPQLEARYRYWAGEVRSLLKQTGWGGSLEQICQWVCAPALSAT